MKEFNVEMYRQLAVRRIKEFSKVNRIDVSKKMLKIPFYTFNEYWKTHKVTNINQYMPDDMFEDLGTSEAILLPSDEEITGAYGIIVPERIKKYSDEFIIILFIHEMLHYADLPKHIYDSKPYEISELEVTVISILISLNFKRKISEILEIRKFDEIREYCPPENLLKAIEVLKNITEEDFRERLTLC